MALMRQIESGQIPDSKRNRKKLTTICLQIPGALTEGWSLYQTALTLEALTDPDYLDTLKDQWPPDAGTFDPHTAAALLSSIDDPEAISRQIKNTVQASLGTDPMLVLEQMQEHLAHA